MSTRDTPRIWPPTDASDPNNLPVLLTVAECACLLRCSESTVRRMIKRGDLLTGRVGAGVRIHRRTVIRIFDAARVPAHTDAV